MIPISRPSIKRKDMDSVLTCLVTDDLGPGSRAQQLTSALSEVIGVAGGIALRERGRALSLAMSLLELPAGSRVALDPLAPAYYHDTITAAGLRPCYADVQPDSGCLNVSQLADLNADAVISRTTLGFVPDLDALQELGVPIVEDITEGVGANTGDRRVGTIGRFSIVGMEPDGIITAGGGALLLASARADRTRLQQAADAMPRDVLLPDMNAALGLTQVKELERFVSRRSELAAVFARAVSRGKHSILFQPGDAENIHFSFPVVLSGPVSEVSGYARKKGVEAELAFTSSVLSLHGTLDRSDTEERATNEVPAEAEFPEARRLLLRCLLFPLFPALSGSEAATVERVLSTLP